MSEWCYTVNSDTMSEQGGWKMPKGSPELTNARKEEIINACEKLYKTLSFKEITLKEISTETSFTRTSIYNYFRRKRKFS